MESSGYLSRVFDVSCLSSKTGWEAAAWASEENQKLLFDLCLSLMNDYENSTILDVGCGQGDLFGHLGGLSTYKGIDISSEMIKAARKKYSNIDVEKTDLSEFQKDYDWVVGVGPFNLDINYGKGLTEREDEKIQMTYLSEAIEKMYQLARKGVVVTVLSESLVENKLDGLYYYSTTKVIKSCLKLNKKMIVDHLRAPTQFIIMIPKENN